MKLVKIKTLEARVWKLCKEITRSKYPHICISCGKAAEGKQLHCGHYYRKKFVPMQIKYRLDILRNQCSYCNRRPAGNLEWYTVGLIREGYTTNKFLEIAEAVEHARLNPMNLPEKRSFLLDLEQHYVTLLASLYQRTTGPVI